jgi:hypothetical protein
MKAIPTIKIIQQLRIYFSDSNFFTECNECVVSLYELNHKMNLIEKLASKYITLRTYYVLDFQNQEMLLKSRISRQSNSRAVIFANL